MSEQDRAKVSVTIDRSHWCRGDMNGVSRMLNGLDCMCCLGFLARACGYRDLDIAGLPDPRAVVRATTLNLFPVGMVLVDPDPDVIPVNSGAVGLMIEDNDSVTLSEDEREIRIRQRMAAFGVAVTFVDSTEESP